MVNREDIVDLDQGQRHYLGGRRGVLSRAEHHNEYRQCGEWRRRYAAAGANHPAK